MVESPKSSTKNRWPAVVGISLGVLTVLVYFAGLSTPFLGPDEARYAQVGREMYERSDWITPTLGGYLWFEKPALLYWLEIIFYNIFGVSEFSARLGPALFGLGTVAALWALGKFEEKRTGEVGLAYLIAVTGASTLGVIVFSHGATFDIVVTFPLTAAIVCGWAAVTGERKTGIPLFLFYVFIGLALLAKGLIGVLFPIAILAFYFLLSRQWPGRNLSLSLVWGIPLAALVASPWYLPMYLRHDARFIDEFIIQHHFQRFTSNKYQHPQPFYFFLWVLPLMVMPWAFFAFGGIARAIKSVLGRDTRRHDLSRFALAWTLVPLVFFSLSGSKLPGYILPAVPGCVVLAALFLDDLIRKRSIWNKIVPAAAAAIMAGCLAVIFLALPNFAAGDSVAPLMAAANNRGYRTENVLMLHTVSHNAEFYAAGRLVRNEDGSQRRLFGPGDVLPFLAGGGRVLVMVPPKYLPQLTNFPAFNTEVIGANDELVIAAVQNR